MRYLNPRPMLFGEAQRLPHKTPLVRKRRQLMSCGRNSEDVMHQSNLKINNVVHAQVAAEALEMLKRSK